jgi:AraC-like DNA-binding protein
MDVLSEVLRVVRLSSAVFFTAEFSSPWAIKSPGPIQCDPTALQDLDCVSLFHIVIEGECIVECRERPPVRVLAGDVVILPRGDQYTMRSDDGVSHIPIDAIFSKGAQNELSSVSFGGGGLTSRLICGYLNCDHRFAPLAKALPAMLVVRGWDGSYAIEAIDCDGPHSTAVPCASGTWLGTTLKFTVNEAKSGRPGNAAMLGRLTELMFVEVVREYMQQLPDGQGGWLGALRDPQVGTALRLLHERPLRNWTVDDLAREVAVSRSSLAQRFTHLVGESPMRYLARWRIELAKQMLREGGHTVQQIGTRLGYESQAAFNRAFKRLAGAPPAVWRRTSRPFAAYGRRVAS